MLNPIREEKKKRARVLPRAYFLSCVKFYTTKHSANDPARRRRLQISFHTHTGSSFFLLLSAVLRHAPPQIANSDRIVPIVFSVICLVFFYSKNAMITKESMKMTIPATSFSPCFGRPASMLPNALPMSAAPMMVHAYLNIVTI